MSFTELNDGIAAAEYIATLMHDTLGLGSSLKIVSNSATGEVSEADAEQIFSDLQTALAGSPFTLLYPGRTRVQAFDEWAEDPA